MKQRKISHQKCQNLSAPPSVPSNLPQSEESLPSRETLPSSSKRQNSAQIIFPQKKRKRRCRGRKERRKFFLQWDSDFVYTGIVEPDLKPENAEELNKDTHNIDILNIQNPPQPHAFRYESISSQAITYRYLEEKCPLPAVVTPYLQHKKAVKSSRRREKHRKKRKRRRAKQGCIPSFFTWARNIMASQG